MYIIVIHNMIYIYIYKYDSNSNPKYYIRKKNIFLKISYFRDYLLSLFILKNRSCYKPLFLYLINRFEL